MTRADPLDIAKRTKRKPTKIGAWDCGGMRMNVRGEWFHATGTVRSGGGSIRIRKTFDVRTSREKEPAAERECRRPASEVRAQVGGVRKSVAPLHAKRLRGWMKDKSVLGYLIADAECRRQIVEDRASVPVRGVSNNPDEDRGAA